jgi:Lar family restriction alleviation protein
MGWNPDVRLEDCPFCGSMGCRYIKLAYEEHLFWAYCEFCGSKGPVSINKEDVALKWNRRTK